MTASKALLGSVLWAGAIVLSSSAAEAASARLSYSAPEGCPGETAFVSALTARGASLERAGEARLFEVRIEHNANGFSGSFQIGEGSEASGARRVHGSTCAEVSDALAVVAAIALESGSEPSPAAAPPDGAAPVVTPVTVSVAPAPVVAVTPLSPAPVEPRAPTLKKVLYQDQVEVPAGQLSLGYMARYTLSAGAALGVIPGLTLPRLDFSIARANLVSAPGDQDFLLGAVFRVRWSFLGPAEYHAPGFDTQLWGLKAGLGSCAPLAYDPDGLVLELCSEFAVGVMGLDTRDAAGNKTQSKTVGLGTVSLEAHTQYSLGSSLYLDLNLGGELWVSKLSAERPDGSQLFHSSTFNAFAVAGLGLRF
ncbi:MAG TPA: hypothetical protein VFS67_09265 [Polyangiaceae bacterium]|nr:hypothetical protein [Polyangiaceae bacterium]